MISEIQKALDEGFTSEQVVKFLLKKFPNYASKIQKALTAGFSTDQVLKFLAGGRKSLNSDQPMTDHQKTRSKDIEQRENVNKRFGQGAALVGGALATPYIAELAIPMAEASLQRVLPSGLNNLGASVPQQLRTALQQGKPTVPQQPPNVNAGNMPQGGNIPQAKTSITDIITKFKGLPEQIDKLKASGNGPEEIAAYLKKFQPKYAENLEKEAGRPIEEIIGEYLQSQNQLKPNELIGKPVEQTAISPQPVEKPEEIAHVPELQGTEQSIKEPIPEAAKSTEEAKEPEEPAKPIAKKDIVASPQGVGEVLEIRNGKALVEVDGKKHVIPEDELEPEPEEVKKAKFDFDIASIPEELRSAPLNEVYIPHDRRHVSVKYNAGLKPIRYLYYRKDNKPIHTDYINKIVKGVQLPITSGLNFWGAWDAEKSDSRGAANYEELVKNAQEEGEPDDPNKDYWFYKEEALYEHPYIQKGHEYLREKEKEFNEKKRKRKKK